MKVWGALLFLSLIASVSSHGYEVDNFTARESIQRDSMSVLDEQVNQVLERSIHEANRTMPNPCNRAVLRQEIVRWTRPSMISFLEIWAATSNRIERSKVGFSTSIYSGVGFFDSLVMSTWGIGRTFKLNGFYVGTDKIGHFFMQGLEYYDLVFQDGKSLDEVLRTAHREDGIYGLSGTGVKSYADMAANYDGFRFWSALSRGEAPYVRCDENGKWQQGRKFSWADYVTAAWDEGINCSDFNPAIAVEVDKGLKRLGLSCPITADACRAILRLPKAEFYVSPKCGAQAL